MPSYLSRFPCLLLAAFAPLGVWVVGALLGGIFVAVFVGCLIVRHPSAYLRLSHDLPGSGVQKFHLRPTPRIGGVAIFFGFVAAVLMMPAELAPGSPGDLPAMAAACALFAFTGGLVEDFTKRVEVRLRLLLTFASATLGFFLLDARITELKIPGVDWALQFTFVSIAFTLFAVGGFAHAMNIVDGFNGLAGVVALIFLAVIAYVARAAGDEPIMWSALLLGAAIAGFLVLNFPRGLLFLGDGGAYLIGFLIAEFALMLVHRNSEVSPWFALTLLSYPIVETLFSMYRKRVLRGRSAGLPDGLHLHMLIHKRLVRRYGAAATDRVWCNTLTSPFLWVLALFGAVPAALFWNRTEVLVLAVLVFVVLYVKLYWQIVRFRAPKVLGVRRAMARSALETADAARQ